MTFSVLICSMAGYAMNVYQFRLKKVMNMFIMMTMMVPTQIGIIGYMIEMREDGTSVKNFFNAAGSVVKTEEVK